MKKLYFLIGALAVGSLLTSAKSGPDPMYMVLTMRNGQLKAVNIEEVNRLTFPGGTMNVEKKDASTEQIVLTEIANMEFSENSTGGIPNLTVDESPIKYNPATSTLQFVGGKELSIYDINGKLVIRHASTAETQVLDLDVLSAGVYIVNYNGQSIKILK